MAKKIIYLVGSIISLVFIIISCVSLYRMGILRDELGISGNIGLGLWIILFVCLISFIVFLYLLLSKSNLAKDK